MKCQYHITLPAENVNGSKTPRPKYLSFHTLTATSLTKREDSAGDANVDRGAILLTLVVSLTKILRHRLD